MLIHKDLGDKRSNLVTTLQEYDLEIKNAKIVWGQGLCKLLTETIDTIFKNVDKVKVTEDIQHACVTPDILDSQYSDLVYYLNHGTAPSHLEFKKKHAIRIKATQY